MLVVTYLPECEAVAPEMATPTVFLVELLRVDAVDAVERSREEVADALDDEVVVIRHQAERVDVKGVLLDCPPELCEEAPPVSDVPEHGLPRDAARRHVPDAVGGKGRAR